MNYVIEMGLNSIIYTQSFMKIISGIQKFIGGIHTQAQRHTHTHTREGDLKSLILFFRNKGSMLTSCSHRPISFFKRRKVG
jgi:hypothetical protein